MGIIMGNVFTSWIMFCVFQRELGMCELCHSVMKLRPLNPDVVCDVLLSPLSGVLMLHRCPVSERYIVCWILHDVPDEFICEVTGSWYSLSKFLS